MIQRTDEGHWTVDKKVPVALIVTIILGGLAHTGTLVWWASSTTSRVDVLERTVAAVAPQADRLTRVEVKVDSIQRTLDKIEGLVQRRPASSSGGAQ